MIRFRMLCHSLFFSRFDQIRLKNTSFLMIVLVLLPTSVRAATESVPTNSTSVLDPHYDLYSESTYIEAQRNLANSTRLRLEFGPWYMGSPYVVGGNEWSRHLPSIAAPEALSIGSHLYAGLGLRLNWGPLSLFAESRHRKYYRAPSDANSPALATSDQRILLVLGLWREFRPTLVDYGSLFAELYSEALFSTAAGNNTAGSGFLRPGLRFGVTPTLNIDAFVKLLIAVDSSHYDYSNRGELEAGLRGIQAIDWFTVGLGGSYAAKREFNASRGLGSSAAGYSILLTLGGAI